MNPSAFHVINLDYSRRIVNAGQTVFNGEVAVVIARVVRVDVGSGD